MQLAGVAAAHDFRLTNLDNGNSSFCLSVLVVPIVRSGLKSKVQKPCLLCLGVILLRENANRRNANSCLLLNSEKDIGQIKGKKKAEVSRVKTKGIDKQ